jgi:hypothetical protein
MKTTMLTRGDVGNLISALDLAIELTAMNIRSLLPADPKLYEPTDEENAETWTANLKIFRGVRRKLQRIEAR